MSIDMLNRPNSVVARVIECAKKIADKITLQNVCVGLSYTSVQLSNQRVGVAMTFTDTTSRACSMFSKETKPLCSKPAREVVSLLSSSHRVEASIGLACANALFNQPDRPYLTGDIRERLHLYASDKVGMVGYFGPLIKTIREKTRELVIFELIDREIDGVFPAVDALEILPECDVVLITATSIINHTIDQLLETCVNCSRVFVLGASTPMEPHAFVGTPVTTLFGVVVADSAKVMQTISEGGGMCIFKKFIKKVSLPVTKGK